MPQRVSLADGQRLCNACFMSEPQWVKRSDVRWDLADRMAKALLVSKIGVQEMADLLEVNRNTVGAWLNRRNDPPTAKLELWAQYTRVPLEWIQTGQWPARHDDPSMLVNGA